MSLPVEILDQIFSLLTLADLSQAARVSHLWQYAVEYTLNIRVKANLAPNGHRLLF